MSRKICVVVTARPSYARIRTALTAIRDHPDLELQLVVAASALLDRYGNADTLVDVLEQALTPAHPQVIVYGNVTEFPASQRRCNLQPRLPPAAGYGFGVALQTQTGVGGGRPGLGAVDQLLPERSLQRLQTRGHRRLGYVQFAGRAGKATRLDDGQKRLNGCDVHTQTNIEILEFQRRIISIFTIVDLSYDVLRTF